MEAVVCGGTVSAQVCFEQPAFIDTMYVQLQAMWEEIKCGEEESDNDSVGTAFDLPAWKASKWYADVGSMEGGWGYDSDDDCPECGVPEEYCSCS